MEPLKRTEGYRVASESVAPVVKDVASIVPLYAAGRGLVNGARSVAVPEKSLSGFTGTAQDAINEVASRQST